MGWRLAGNAQYTASLRGGRQDDALPAGTLPIESGARCSAQDRDARRRISELRSPRRVPGNDRTSGGQRMNDIVFSTTTQLAAAIRVGHISASEVLEAHLEQIAA